ncbi:hypothetical protein VTP01DRAFT_7307 [Rhizomucor pusillus]|uniref:uncharacterized protein n=1 Tax=Rhizomucor pusillus TaxID=4840 RepID=UPI003743558B
MGNKIANRVAKQQKSNGVIHGRVTSKKKQQKIDRAIRLEKRHLAELGIIPAPEEEMKDANEVVKASPAKQKVVIEVPAEILEAAANGPGTTLGQPQ